MTSAVVSELGPRRRRHDIDPDLAEQAIGDLLKALGADPGDPHLRETPRRVAQAFAEMLHRPDWSPTTFPNEEEYDELVLVREIPFRSLCEHHLLPFRGVAHVAYLPGERLIGLSKLARIVDLYARDLQVQERLTSQVADWIEEELEAAGVGVILEAEHLCMTTRGALAVGSQTRTMALRGRLKDDDRARQEFLDLAMGGRR